MGRPAGDPRFRLTFEHDSRAYVWTGSARDAEAAEAKARKALFGKHAFAGIARPVLVQLVQGGLR